MADQGGGEGKAGRATSDGRASHMITLRISKRMMVPAVRRDFGFTGRARELPGKSPSALFEHLKRLRILIYVKSPRKSRLKDPGSANVFHERPAGALRGSVDGHGTFNVLPDRDIQFSIAFA